MDDGGGVDTTAVAMIAVFCVLATRIIAAGIWRRRSFHRRARDFASNYQQALAERGARLAAEVAKRRAEEQATDRGTPIWFSRYMHGGRLKHWVLVIAGTKYELRRAADGRYVHHVQPWTIAQEKREAALAERQIPEVDGYYVCLIGWTQLPADRLAAVAGEVMARFGSYHLLWNNCQDFLQRFADQIVARKALDWSWFREHAKTEYQEEQKLPPPPEAVVAAQAANMQTQLQVHQQHQQHQHTIQQNIQLNNMLVQQQMQQSVAMQNINNPAMNPALNPAMNPGAFGMGGGGA